MSGNVTSGVLFLVDTLLSLYAMVVLLRFLLQMVRADFYNPLSQFVVRATNPLLQPLRRVIPGAWGIDFAALLLTWLIMLVTVTLLAMIAGVTLPVIALLGYAVLKGILLLIHLYFFTILVQVILSWVSPGWSPVAGVLYTVNAPLLRPVQKVLPSLGGIDLSPLFVIILLQFVSFLVPLPGIFR